MPRWTSRQVPSSSPSPSAHRGNLTQSAERLSEALADLSVALNAQRDAMQRWREALIALSERMKRLGTSTV